MLPKEITGHSLELLEHLGEAWKLIEEDVLAGLSDGQNLSPELQGRIHNISKVGKDLAQLSAKLSVSFTASTDANGVVSPVFERANIAKEAAPKSLDIAFDSNPLPTNNWSQQDFENTRIAESGIGQELVRRVYVEQLRGWMSAFLDSAGTVDILTLYQVFELLSHPRCRTHPAAACQIVELFLTMLGFDLKTLLESGLQRRPKL